MFDQLPTDSSRLVIKGARVVDPSQNLDAVCNVFLVGGRIAGLSAEDIPDAEAVDARGLVCAPGLVDMHVHLRDPGQTYKEDIESGCRAAAAGGVTSLACMPNTVPALDDPAVIGDVVKRAADAKARVYPVAAVTAA